MSETQVVVESTTKYSVSAGVGFKLTRVTLEHLRQLVDATRDLANGQVFVFVNNDWVKPSAIEIQHVAKEVEP